MSKQLASNKLVNDLVLLWAEFEEYWYSDRLGQYKDEPIEPTINDFMNWITENL